MKEKITVNKLRDYLDKQIGKGNGENVCSIRVGENGSREWYLVDSVSEDYIPGFHCPGNDYFTLSSEKMEKPRVNEKAPEVLVGS